MGNLCNLQLLHWKIMITEIKRNGPACLCINNGVIKLGAVANKNIHELQLFLVIGYLCNFMFLQLKCDQMTFLIEYADTDDLKLMLFIYFIFLIENKFREKYCQLLGN